MDGDISARDMVINEDIKREDQPAEWSAEGFLEDLLSAAGSKPCDATPPDKQDVRLPEWFDEQKFERGQRYYYNNSFSMFVAKLCGLLSLLAIPSILRILMFTQRSSVPFSAYKRYVATLLHTALWYDVKLTKDSRSWSSLMSVRARHYASGRAACSQGAGAITQRDMALTQFGFMGYALIRPRLLGITCDDRKDREAFVHVWRCIGHVLGIDDRFNICRSSLDETERLCELLLQRVFRPHIEQDLPDFRAMTEALLAGLWCFNPFLNYDTFMYFTKRLCSLQDYRFPIMNKLEMENNNEDLNVPPKTKVSSRIVKLMHWYSRTVLFFMVYTFEILMNYRIAREFFNSQIRMSLFIIKNFPFLAFYRFAGYKECFVDLGIDDGISKKVC